METIQDNLNRVRHIQPRWNIITQFHGAILVERINGAPHALTEIATNFW